MNMQRQGNGIQGRVAAAFGDVSPALLWRLIWPQLATMLCTMALGLTDMWVGGRIGADVQASLGMSGQLLHFYMVIGAALGAGGMAAVSQSMGAARADRAAYYCALILALAVSFGVLIAACGWIFRSPILSAMRVPDAITGQTRYYYCVILAVLPAQYVMNVGATLFRASSNVMAPLLVVAAVSLANMAGDLVFGLGLFGMPRFGGSGIIWSTFASLCMGASLTVVLLRRGGLLARFALPPMRWTRAALPYLVKVAVPALISQVLWQFGYLVLFGIVGSLGVDAIAGMTAGLRIESLLYMPAVAFNVTASILVGNRLGAGDDRGAARAGRLIVILGVAAMSLAGLAMWPFRWPLAEAFSESAAVRELIAWYLFFNILCVPFTVGGMIYVGIMTGAGATRFVFMIQGGSVWLIRLPVAWLFAHPAGFGAPGVFGAMLASSAVQFAVFTVMFARGGWTRHSMRNTTKRR